MLEKVNKKTLRVVLNDYVSPYRDLLDKVSNPTLYVARLKAIAIEAYKCYVNENPQYINSMFDSVDKPYNLRGGPLAEQPKVNTTSSGLNTFTYQAAKMWNSLPSHSKEAPSLSDFKQHILKWPGPDCQCGCCALCRSYDVWSLCTLISYLFYKCFYRLLVNCHGFFFPTSNVCFKCLIKFSPVSYSSIIFHSVA